MNMNVTTRQLTQELQLLSARETAKILLISEKALYNLTKAGKVVAIREGRMVRYDPRDVQEYIESRKTPRTS
jgi:excisionase family DNA binding protein